MSHSHFHKSTFLISLFVYLTLCCCRCLCISLTAFIPDLCYVWRKTLILQSSNINDTDMHNSYRSLRDACLERGLHFYFNIKSQDCRMEVRLTSHTRFLVLIFDRFESYIKTTMHIHPWIVFCLHMFSIKHD